MNDVVAPAIRRKRTAVLPGLRPGVLIVLHQVFWWILTRHLLKCKRIAGARSPLRFTRRSNCPASSGGICACGFKHPVFVCRETFESAEAARLPSGRAAAISSATAAEIERRVTMNTAFSVQRCSRQRPISVAAAAQSAYLSTGSPSCRRPCRPAFPRRRPGGCQERRGLAPPGAARSRHPMSHCAECGAPPAPITSTYTGVRHTCRGDA